MLKLILLENLFDSAGEPLSIATLYPYAVSKYIDGVASIAINALSMFYAYRLVREDVHVFVHRSALPEILARLVRIALSNPVIKDVNNIKTISAEPNRCIVFMEIELDPDLDLKIVDDIVNYIKDTAFRYLSNVYYIVVELRKLDRELYV